MSPSRVRIVRLLPSLDFGGVESRVALQAQHFSHLSRYKLTVISLGHGVGAAADKIRSVGVPVVSVGCQNPISVTAIQRTVNLLRRLDPHILHSSIFEANISGLIAGALTGIPVRIAEEVGAVTRSVHLRVLLGSLYRLASVVVAVTDKTKQNLIENEHLPPERICRIYNCASPDFFPTSPVLKPTGSRPRFRFLLVGRLHPIKNFGSALRALERVLLLGLDAEMWVVGEGPEGDDMKRFCLKSTVLRSRVVFLGHRRDLFQIYRECDAYVLPSWSEGCSISLIEALACGLPCLVSDVPGNREVLSLDELTAWMFTPGDTVALSERMACLVALPNQALERLSRVGQNRAYSNFSPSAYLENLEGLYGRLLSRTATVDGPRRS